MILGSSFDRNPESSVRPGGPRAWEPSFWKFFATALFGSPDSWMEAGEMNETSLREHLAELLNGGSAHANIEKALRELPVSLAQATIPGVPNTPWRLLEHIRLAQWDILEFSRDPGHVSPEFPDGYWPDSDTAPDTQAWSCSVAAICGDLQSMIDLVRDPATDLFSPIPHGGGQTVLREAMLVADHNAYHLGQLLMLHRALS